MDGDVVAVVMVVVEVVGVCSWKGGKEGEG